MGAAASRLLLRQKPIPSSALYTSSSVFSPKFEILSRSSRVQLSKSLNRENATFFQAIGGPHRKPDLGRAHLQLLGHVFGLRIGGTEGNRVPMGSLPK